MDASPRSSDEQKLSAISEPDFDLDAVEVPDEGPMTFEFDIEVRPEFDLPQWKGLTIERPVREFTDDGRGRRHLKNVLARHGQLVPYDGPAELGRLRQHEPHASSYRRPGAFQRRRRS